MSEINWLLLANVAIWLGFGLYLAFLGYQQKLLGNSLKQSTHE